jgi:hypothetical protein
LKETVARELFDTIRAKVTPETVFILVLSDSESSGLVSNLGSETEVSEVLFAIAEEHKKSKTREADGTGYEARGSGGHSGADGRGCNPPAP